MRSIRKGGESLHSVSEDPTKRKFSPAFGALTAWANLFNLSRVDIYFGNEMFEPASSPDVLSFNS